MLRMSWSTFRDRWPVFIGAILTVSLGVALAQASLLALVSAASPTIPPELSPIEETTLRGGLAGAVSMLGMMVGISVFVAFFIVGTTFSFTVAQRSRDFALLRLVGASRRQVSRLLLGEALLLGTLGTLFGVLLGIPLLRFETYMLKRMDLVPDGFSPDWQMWILAVSAATGIGVAVIASLGASRSASRVRPLEALRETDRADKVMSLSRWIIGLVALAGAAALLGSPSSREGDPLSTALPGLIVLVIAVSALTPLAVPLIGGAIGLILRPVLRNSPINELASANLRDGVRRSASTAAPIVILVALVVGFSGTINVLTAGTQEETQNFVDGDVVVTATEQIGEQLTALDGVMIVSEEVALEVWVESVNAPTYYERDGIAIDPITYSETHNLNGVIGDLNLLQGETVALDEFYASELKVDVGDMVSVRIDDISRDMEIVAIFPFRLQGTEVLLPLEFVPADDYRRIYVVQADEGTAPVALSEQITGTFANGSSASGQSAVSASTVDDWIESDLKNQREFGEKIVIAIMGSVTIYIVIAMINAVVISASARRSEFAIARLTGLDRGQVVRMALWESLTVVAVGVVVGSFAAGATIAVVTIAVSDIVGTGIVVPPWGIFGAVVGGVAVIIGGSSVLTTLAATRQSAIEVAGARE